MTTIKMNIYQAIDGKTFEDKKECQKHEDELRNSVTDEVITSSDVLLHSIRDISNVSLAPSIVDILKSMNVTYICLIRNKKGLDLINWYFATHNITEYYSNNPIQFNENDIMSGIKIIMQDDSCNNYRSDVTIDSIISGMINLKECFYNKMEETDHEE